MPVCVNIGLRVHTHCLNLTEHDKLSVCGARARPAKHKLS